MGLSVYSEWIGMTRCSKYTVGDKMDMSLSSVQMSFAKRKKREADPPASPSL